MNTQYSDGNRGLLKSGQALGMRGWWVGGGKGAAAAPGCCMLPGLMIWGQEQWQDFLVPLGHLHVKLVAGGGTRGAGAGAPNPAGSSLAGRGAQPTLGKSRERQAPLRSLP